MIKTIKILETRSKVLDSYLSSDFEKSFIRNITRDRNIYNESKTFGGGILDAGSVKEYVYLSKKQEKIYLDIEFKYNNSSLENDLFEKYTKMFKEKNIILDSFDERHLQGFKGVFIESENFKKWVNGIYNQIKI